MEVAEQFLTASKHPEPRYGCVCGFAHMGRPEIVLAHFFEKYYSEIAKYYWFGHVYTMAGYIMTVNCRNCGRRIFLSDWLTEAVEQAYKFMLKHKC